jgi:hypothetical protein
LASRTTAASTPIEVLRWEPHDFGFSCSSVEGNPFNVAFSAEVAGPGGVKLNVPGFYDGNGTWKLRISAATEGAWSFVTHSDVADLNGKGGAFVSVANHSLTEHGSLHVNLEHPHQLVFEDGTRFFPMGYECDWLWALDTNDPKLKVLNPFLDRLAANGFNFVVLNAFAQDTSWRRGKTGADDFGPPPLYAWEGTNDQPDHSRFNLAYWQHYDRVIEALYQHGMGAHILMKVYNKQVKWPANGSPEDDLYYRWLIARYSAYPNVVWDLAKEAQYEKNLDYKMGRLRFVRTNDSYHRLLTVHDDKANYDKGAYDDLVDFRSDQQNSDWRETMLAHLAQRTWPVSNIEYGYEHGPLGANDKTYNVAQSAEEVCRRAWEIVLAGGSVGYYYTYTAWDVIRPQDTPPGYAYFKHLREFFETTGYWRMTSVNGVSSDGYCLADPGHEYIIFLNAAKPFTSKLEGLTQPLKAQWYRPFTGQWKAAGTLSNGTTELKPPPEWPEGPVALHVGTPAS